MKKIWFILLFVACLIAGAKVQAQNVFRVECVDKTQSEDNIYVYTGDLIDDNELSISVYGFDESNEKTQFHMMFKDIVISLILDQDLRLGEYYSAPWDNYSPPFTERLRIAPDIISSGTVVVTNLTDSVAVTKGKIEQGYIRIEYELYPKEITVSFFNVQLGSPNKNKLIKKT